MSASTTFKNCQSCGMPMKKDPRGGGTNADGTKSAMYCSHCYAGGEFTAPGLSASEMQALVQQKLREFGFPGFVAGLFTRRIPKLERWVAPTGPSEPPRRRQISSGAEARPPAERYFGLKNGREPSENITET